MQEYIINGPDWISKQSDLYRLSKNRYNTQIYLFSKSFSI